MIFLNLFSQALKLKKSQDPKVNSKNRKIGFTNQVGIRSVLLLEIGGAWSERISAFLWS